jgi:hypothetical protein
MDVNERYLRNASTPIHSISVLLYSSTQSFVVNTPYSSTTPCMHAGVQAFSSAPGAALLLHCRSRRKSKYSEYNNKQYCKQSAVRPAHLFSSLTPDEAPKAAKAVLDDGMPSGSRAVPRLPCGTSLHTTPGRIAHLHRHAPSTTDSLSASSSSIICSRHQRPQRPHHLFQLLDRNAGQLDQV